MMGLRRAPADPTSEGFENEIPELPASGGHDGMDATWCTVYPVYARGHGYPKSVRSPSGNGQLTRSYSGSAFLPPVSATIHQIAPSTAPGGTATHSHHG